MKRLIFILPLVLFAVVAVAFAIGLGRDPAKLPSMLIGKPLPSFALPPIEAGRTGLASADFQGEPKLLNVFGSWCVVCKIEHPMLMQLKAQGVPVLGLDWKDPPGAGAKWLADNGDPYHATGDDRSGRTAIDLGVTGAPETFVVDKAGRVRFKQVGAVTPEVWENTIKPLMDRLRQES